MLDEVELLVFGGRPKVLAFVGVVVFLQVACFVDDRDTTFLTEWWVGEHDAKAFARVAREAVCARLNWTWISVDAVKVQVHNAKSSCVGDELPAFDELGSQVLLLIFV